MEDYRQKLENLSKERLLDLVERYEETLQRYERRLQEARIVGMASVAAYQEAEIEKKQGELAEIKKILATKENE